MLAPAMTTIVPRAARPLALLAAVPLCAALLLPACGNGDAPVYVDATELPEFRPTTFADSVAAAHGYAAWDDVERIDFRFDVDVNDTNRVARDWTWYPRADSVVLRGSGGETAYRRNAGALAGGEREADANFINDSYWLLMPFYLVWSADGYAAEVQRGVSSPLGDEPRDMLTVRYGSEGGYTPGDAYDLYVDDDYRLREWVYRRGGQAQPSMTMDWSGYREIEGLALPSDHRGEGPVRIHHPVVRVVRRTEG